MRRTVVRCGDLGRLAAIKLETRQSSPIPLGGAAMVRHLGCDRDGHLWLAGHGLWQWNGDAAIPVRALDPIIGRREIWALGRETEAGLAVAIENRGVALLSTFPTQAAAPRPRCNDDGDLLRSAPIREAVFLEEWPEDSRDLFDEVAEALAHAKAGTFAGWVSRVTYSTSFVFYGPNAARMVEVMRPILERSGKRFILVRRDGERGAREQRIEIK